MHLIRRLRWWELAPEAVVLLGLSLFAVTERSAAASAFGSTKAIVLMAVTAFTWIVARLLLLQFAPWPAARVVVFAVAGLGVLRVVVFPAYDSKTVVETLPVATVVAQPAPSTTTPSTITPSTTTPAPASAPAPTTAPAPPPAQGPVRLRTGAIRGIDHRATGTAAIYAQPDGSFTVGLEDINIQPGPDYDVYVVPGADRDSKQGGVRLDDLRGNVGTQYYSVPAGAEVGAGEWTVLVWCQTFDVPVASATPT